MGRIGRQVAECLTVTEHHGTPLIPLTPRPLFGAVPGELDAPQVTTVHIATIRIEEYRALVGRERSLRRRAAVPHFSCCSRGGIRNPDGPRMRLVRGNEVALRRVSRSRRPP